MNPIKNIWSIIKLRLRKNVYGLKQFCYQVRKIWRSLSHEICKKVQKVYPENARQLLTTRQLDHVLDYCDLQLVFIVHFYVSVFCCKFFCHFLSYTFVEHIIVHIILYYHILYILRYKCKIMMIKFPHRYASEDLFR